MNPSCYKEKTRKARKDHKCCECGNTINKGDNYNYFSGVWDGSPESYKTCLECYALKMYAAGLDYYGEEGPYFGELVYWLFEYDEWQSVPEELKTDQFKVLEAEVVNNEKTT